jgi:hypothetical protein
VASDPARLIAALLLREAARDELPRIEAERVAAEEAERARRHAAEETSRIALKREMYLLNSATGWLLVWLLICVLFPVFLVLYNIPLIVLGCISLLLVPIPWRRAQRWDFLQAEPSEKRRDNGRMNELDSVFNSNPMLWFLYIVGAVVTTPLGLGTLISYSLQRKTVRERHGTSQ